jgi:acylphosphatase
MVCKRVRYFGQVQGVGFRWTAQHTAGGYEVSGHIRNLADGSVELVVEGEPDQVEGFLNALAGRMGSYIDRTTVIDEPVGNYDGFRIRH